MSIRFIRPGDPIPKGSRVYQGYIPDEDFERICYWATGRIPRIGRAVKRLRIVIVGRDPESHEEPPQ